MISYQHSGKCFLSGNPRNCFQKPQTLQNNRSSRPEVVCKNGVLKHFLKFKGKHLCHSLFFNKVAGLKPATLLKKRLVQVISWNICEIFKNSPGGCKTINLRVSLLYKQLHDFRYPYVWAVASFWHHLVLNPLVCGVH